MINTTKKVNASILESQDLFEDIFTPINKRHGFIRSKSPNVPIYFYRYIGTCENKDIYYENLHKLNDNLITLQNLYLSFTNGIPMKTLATSISQISWSGLLIPSPIQRKNLFNILKSKGLFLNMKNNFFDDYIESSFDQTLALYLINEPNVTETVLKNFAVKLLGWIGEFVPKVFNDIDYNPKIEKDIINPKVLFYGEIKKHEIYFLIFLSKLGSDVIYINSMSDVSFAKVDTSNKYSKLMKLPKDSPLIPLNFKTNNNSFTSSIKSNNLSFAMPFKDSINTILKSSTNIFSDLIIPSNERIGFLSGSVPYIPVYFYRYIGINQNEDDYYNNIFRLDKTLSILDSLYLKFTHSLPVSTVPKLITSTINIWQYVDPFDSSLNGKLATLLMEHKLFPTANHNLSCSMANSFSYILDLYCNEEKNVSLPKIKNLSLKLLSWINDYVPNLMKDFDFQSTFSDVIINPKVIYYGDIKKHELLFLIFLSKLGCDILYINSLSDIVSDIIDSSDLFSKIFELAYKAPLKEFPKEELLIRQETIALKASRELTTTLYADNDGFYRPWQFEEYKTRPATLKTTFYELKSLWNEPSSLRTGFNVENNTVYIPNLFAKISGVHSDLALYWKDFFELKSAENTLFIPEIPFTSATYSKTDLYSLAFVLDKNGLIDKQKLLVHNCYNFSYLKTSLQQIILEKINYLIKSDMLLKVIDKEFKLIILMTILDLNKNILQLLQQYDYPSKIPKLLIYDNNENIFSDEDSIILCFLNLFGFDISILTPTGYNNIEEKIKEKFYDNHKLEAVNFSLSLPNLNDEKKYTKEKGKSFLSNILKQIRH
ncbi:YceG family protein [Clostridium estertheticum]|uniref:YceG family protein n=1 Tax=Clostridium estertheticum TaxID=238834 RepID=UPI001C7DC3E8|nr:YceG family protein [Clostridium estertheticum]MBX4261833.1 YceG family protein [Clostridium estertheticum]WLC71257.1 YceG family protein [Clostridium estertheticum]